MSESHHDLGYSLPKSPQRPVRSKGTRWPEGQAVPDQWYLDAAAARAKHGLHPINLAIEAERFVNHFTSGAARKETATLWHRRFINWVIGSWAPEYHAPAVPKSEDAKKLSPNELKILDLVRRKVRTMSSMAVVEKAVRLGEMTAEEAKRFGY